MSKIVYAVKKPVRVAMMQWDLKNLDDIIWFVGSTNIEHHIGNQLFLYTKKGRVFVPPMDWVVRGVDGEVYPLRNATKEATYDEVEG